MLESSTGECIMDIDVFKRTTDDWYGNYKIQSDARVSDVVEVSFTTTGPNPKQHQGEFRVCVWGNDDCGMEKDFADDEELAWNCFFQVIGLDYVNKDSLRSLGFVSA
jgi:hypothetical protein